MSRPERHSTRVLVAAGILLAAGPALPAANGIKIGAGRLHPYVEVVGQYDSNVLFSAGGAPVGDLVLHVVPGFELQVPGTDLTVSFDGKVDWNKYLGLESQATKELGKLFAAASLSLAAGQRGAVGLELSDAFRRSDQSPSLSLGTAVVSNWNDLRLAVPFRPGGGALVLSATGQWTLETFEPFVDTVGCDTALNPTCASATISEYGYNRVSGGAEIRWKFLPRTALVLEGSYFKQLPKDAAVSLEAGGLRALAGLAGLVTPRIAVTLKGGWSDTFETAGVPFRTWLANVEVEYVTQAALGGKIGYARDLAVDPGTSYSLYKVHRLYGDAKALLGGRLTVTIHGEWSLLDYELARSSSQVLSLRPAVDYEVTRWGYVGASYQLGYRTAQDAAAAIPAFNYTKHEGRAYLRLVY